jgi:hypothetical protein
VESKVLFRAEKKMVVAIQTHKSTTRALTPCVPALFMGFPSYSISIDAACAVGERFRSAISDDTFEVGIPPPIKITISIGCRSLGAMEIRSTRFWVSLISGFAARNVKVVIA